MAANEEPSQHLDGATVGRIFFVTLVGVPAFVVLMHFFWPSIIWLRALACGLVVVPGVLLLSVLFVLVTEGKGSFINGWAIILPLVAGFLSVNYGWAAPMLTLGGLAALITVGAISSWIRRSSG